MSDTPHVLVVNEIFTHTLQGEGPDAGKPATFLRLYGCPVQCGWCDTPYTWAAGTAQTEARTMNVEKVAHILAQHAVSTGIHRLVISGGEPMRQAAAIATLVRLIPQYHSVEIETSGITPPYAGLIASYNVSPKLAHAHARVHYKLEDLRHYADIGARFKFVVGSVADVEEAASIVRAIGLPPRRTWIMPEGTDEARILSVAREVVGSTIAHGFNLSLRMHVLLWGNTRGR